MYDFLNQLCTCKNKLKEIIFGSWPVQGPGCEGLGHDQMYKYSVQHVLCLVYSSSSKCNLKRGEITWPILFGAFDNRY